MKAVNDVMMDYPGSRETRPNHDVGDLPTGTPDGSSQTVYMFLVNYGSFAGDATKGDNLIPFQSDVFRRRSSAAGKRAYFLSCAVIRSPELVIPT